MLACAALALAAPAPAFAQQVVCQLGRPGPRGYVVELDQTASPRAINQLRTIQHVLCGTECGVAHVFRNSTSHTVMVERLGEYVSKIVYNPGHLNQAAGQFGIDAMFGLFAHAFGHHMEAIEPADWMPDDWGPELRADAWAGCAMARAELSGTVVKRALAALEKFPAAEHPPWPARLDAIRFGYARCAGKTPDW